VCVKLGQALGETGSYNYVGHEAVTSQTGMEWNRPVAPVNVSAHWLPGGSGVLINWNTPRYSNPSATTLHYKVRQWAKSGGIVVRGKIAPSKKNIGQSVYCQKFYLSIIFFFKNAKFGNKTFISENFKGRIKVLNTHDLQNVVVVLTFFVFVEISNL